jgi:nucleotide-binding universal stress UspA family protein
VPTDFSTASQTAVRKAVDLAHHYGGIILLLHVIDLNAHTPPVGPANDAELRARLWKEAQEQMDRQASALKAEAIEVKPVMREGLPAEEILQVANACDLIVIGKPKHKSFLNLFSRRTVETVLKEAPCSVMVVSEFGVDRAGTSR